MVSTRNSLLLSTVVIVVAFGMVLWFTGRGEIGARSTPVSINDPAMSSVNAAASASDEKRMDALLTEIRGLRADLSDIARGNASREPVAKGTGNAELLAAMKDLSAALRERTVESAPGRVAHASVRPPTSSTGFAGIGELMATKGNVSKQHYFWTAQQIVDRYGLPTAMGVSEGSLYLTYNDPVDNHQYHTFHLFDGFVVWAE